MKWNAELYDDKHAFVFEYGENVLELLDVKRRERVLDLGCGTGHLTQRIHERGGVVTGIDSSPELKPGGRFVAEMGGKGNVQHLIEATQQVLRQHGYDKLAEKKLWYFPSMGEYTSRLEKQGFRVTFAAHFDRKTLLQDGRQGVAKWLNMFGPTFFEGIAKAEKEQILKEITDILEPHYNENGAWYADYKRLRFIALK
jgi:trans-aconitate methyltransferase